MIQKAAKSIGKSLSECTVFVVGDRKSDVEMGLNAEGYGILIASNKTEEGSDKEFVTELSVKNKRVYCAKSFIDAARFIQKKITGS